MAYDSSALNLVNEGGIGGIAPQRWTHESVDAGSVVQVTGYITDGGSRGMKVGDRLEHTDNDATPPLTTSHMVVTVSSTYPGAVDLSDGVAITGANSD